MGKRKGKAQKEQEQQVELTELELDKEVAFCDVVAEIDKITGIDPLVEVRETSKLREEIYNGMKIVKH